MINDELLEEYIERFFGYGDLSAPIWFVGKEEGGVPNPVHFNETLERWTKGGKEHVVDIAPRKSLRAVSGFVPRNHQHRVHGGN